MEENIPPQPPQQQNPLGNSSFNKLILLGILVIILVAGAVGYWYFKKNSPQEQVFCTQEAKQCSDGSYVSRTGPNCEFAECPKISADNLPNGWKLYSNTAYGFSIGYPGDWSFKEEKVGKLEPWQEQPGPGGKLNVLTLYLGDNSEARNLIEQGNGRASSLSRLELVVQQVYCGAYTKCSDFVQKDPYEGAEYFSGGRIATKTIGGFRIDVYKGGAYECYDCSEKFIDFLTKQVSAIVCNSQNTLCLQFATHEASMSHEEVKMFFMDKILPTLKLGSKFNTVECRKTEQIYCHG